MFLPLLQFASATATTATTMGIQTLVHRDSFIRGRDSNITSYLSLVISLPVPPLPVMLYRYRANLRTIFRTAGFPLLFPCLIMP